MEKRLKDLPMGRYEFKEKPVYIPGVVAMKKIMDKQKQLEKRLQRIKEIIEQVDNRCLAADGPVTPTLQEITQEEISHIYALACGTRVT